nr:hypothetical protein GCM10020093_070020 [Planobispora longispora]
MLGTGFHDGRLYLVSEHVAGPSLERHVRERGPLHGDELHRLAIATVTALSVIHRSGAAHLRISAGTVLLAADGARLVGLRPAAAAGGPGTPADLFSWAATMVYAATGRYPAGGAPGHAPGGAASGRYPTGHAPGGAVEAAVPGDPAVLREPLRHVVAACLASAPVTGPPRTRSCSDWWGRTPRRWRRHSERARGNRVRVRIRDRDRDRASLPADTGEPAAGPWCSRGPRCSVRARWRRSC